MPTTKIDKLIITGLIEETGSKPVLVWNPATRRVSWQASPNTRIAALEAKLDTDNNFKSIPDPGYTFNAGTRVLTMNANWVGTINGIDYTNPAEQVFPAIPLAASGYSRIDLIVFDTDANFERIAGVESLFTPVAPPKPLNTLEASFLTVGDGYVNAPVIPKTKAPVTSVNGMRGDVTIAKATDINAGLVKTNVTVADPVVYVKETVDTLLEGKANYFLDIKTITGITYNVIIDDILHELVYAGTLPMNVIIPNNSTVAFPIGTIFYTLGTNTGIVTASGAAGVTLSLKAGLSLSAIQNEVRQYTKIGTNTWSVRGDLNLGAVTQTELSYLQGATSNIQAQINAKTSLSGGTANFLMKWLTATTATVSRIWDTGTFLGIGTVNTPTKDLTFGNQGNREIGVEESSNAVVGRDLIVKAGRTINYTNGLFNFYYSFGGKFILENDTNDLYVSTERNTYKRTNSVGDFNLEVNPEGGHVVDMKLGFDNNIFIIKNTNLYVQYNSSGAYLAYPTTGVSGSPIGIEINRVTRDIFIVTSTQKLFKQTAGIGSFVDLNVIPRTYSRLAITSSGKLFAWVYSQGMFEFNGTEFMSKFSINNSIYNCVLTTSKISQDLYISDGYSTSPVLKYDTETLILSTLVSGVNNASCIASKKDGSLLLVTYSSILIKETATGTANLDGGTLKQVAGTGKGTGKSRFEIYTGQKLASGTDMQIETLREYIDENGYHVYTSMPVYADNAAAIAGGLPIGCEYRTATGVKMIVY